MGWGFLAGEDLGMNRLVRLKILGGTLPIGLGCEYEFDVLMIITLSEMVWDNGGAGRGLSKESERYSSHPPSIGNGNLVACSSLVMWSAKLGNAPAPEARRSFRTASLVSQTVVFLLLESLEAPDRRRCKQDYQFRP